MSLKSVTYLTVFAILLAFVQAAIDCQKRPIMKFKTANDCCGLPKPNYKAFPSACAKYTDNFKKPTNLCILECFLNETKTLENGLFNGTNANAVLLKIYNDTSIGDAHIFAFEKCATIVNQSVKEFEANGFLKTASLGQKCSPLAVIFTLCVHKYVYINCPAHFWKSTSSCDQMKEYAKNCDLAPSGRSGKRTGF